LAGVKVVALEKRASGSGSPAQNSSLAIDPAGPQPSQRMKLLVVGRDRHGSQRILEARATPAANLVGVPIYRKDTAQLRMVATKGKLQRARERVGHGRPQRHRFRCHNLLSFYTFRFSSAIK
jgi:hypothetical protein